MENLAVTGVSGEAKSLNHGQSGSVNFVICLL